MLKTHIPDWVLDIKLALEELASKAPHTIEENKISYNPLYRVAVLPEARKSIEVVYGRSKFNSVTVRLFNLLKLDWLKYILIDFRLKAPIDSIVYFKADKKGIVLISPQEQVVLKLVMEELAVSHLEDEILTLKEMKSSPFSEFSSEYIADGMTTNGARWLVTGLRANTYSIQSAPYPEVTFLKEYLNPIMSILAIHYRHSPDFMKLNYGQWKERISESIGRHPEKTTLEALLRVIDEEVKPLGDLTLLLSHIHNDLHAGNILVDDSGIPVIIDWEGKTQALILIDFFDFARRFLQRSWIEKFFFGLFLRKKMSLSSSLRKHFQQYKIWTKVSFHTETPLACEYALYLIYTLERILVFYDKKGMNRLSDRRGFERWVVSTVLKSSAMRD